MTVKVGFAYALDVVLVMTEYTVWLLAAFPTVCGSPTVMEKVGFAACSTDIEGCCGLVLSTNCGGRTGGGCLAPLGEEVPSSSASLLLDPAVCGRDLVLDIDSFTGGVGAAGSSTGSAPSGPRGPAESSRLSRVVDWVSLTCRLGPRDLEGAGLAEMGDVLDDAGAAGSGEAGVSAHDQ